MKREAFFDRDASHYYCEDGKAVGAYCREHFPEDVAQTLAVADGVCRKYFLFNSKWDLEQSRYSLTERSTGRICRQTIRNLSGSSTDTAFS